MFRIACERLMRPHDSLAHVEVDILARLGDRAAYIMPAMRIAYELEDASRKLELSDLVYIQIKKLDHLLNLVGELIIDRDRVLTLSRELDNPHLQTVASHLMVMERGFSRRVPPLGRSTDEMLDLCVALYQQRSRALVLT